MGDFADILRRLWAHETVTYQGPAGDFPELHLGEFPDFEPPPLLLAAIGPKTLDLVGRRFDGALLHPFTSLAGVGEARERVRAAAERAGRDPDRVRVVAQVVTAPDFTEPEVDQVVRARLAAYLSHPGFGEVMATANGWDLAPVHALRDRLRRAAAESAGESASGRMALVETSRHLPAEWITEGSAVGTAAECAATLHRFLDAGADEVVLHGSTADRLETTVKSFTDAQGG